MQSNCAGSNLEADWKQPGSEASSIRKWFISPRICVAQSSNQSLVDSETMDQTGGPGYRHMVLLERQRRTSENKFNCVTGFHLIEDPERTGRDSKRNLGSQPG
jgi:hypothetical protein